MEIQTLVFPPISSLNLKFLAYCTERIVLLWTALCVWWIDMTSNIDSCVVFMWKV